MEAYRENPERKAESSLRGHAGSRNDCRNTKKPKRGLGIGLDQSDPHRETDESRHIVNVEPLHQLTSVGFDGFHAQVQTVGNFFRGLPFRDELEDFALTHAQFRQRTGRPFRLFTVGLNGILRNRRGQVPLTPGDRLEGQLKLGQFCAFQQID